MARQRAEGLALALEGPLAVVVEHGPGHDLDRDRPAVRGLRRPVHRPEAALSDPDGIGDPRDTQTVGAGDPAHSTMVMIGSRRPVGPGRRPSRGPIPGLLEINV